MDPRMRALIDRCNEASEDGCGISIPLTGEIAPGCCAPVLRVEEDRIKAMAMRWGFSAGKGRLVINARSEDAANREMFRALIDHFRCLMPAAGYYEWKKTTGCRYLVSAREPVYLAGLYRVDSDGQCRFVVLTRKAEGEHARIHSRMPVVIDARETARRWLSGEMRIDSAIHMLSDALSIRPLTGEQIEFDFEDICQSE